MNSIEKKLFVDKGLEYWSICDVLLIAVILCPAEVIGQASECNATVELHGAHTRGQIGRIWNQDTSNCVIITELNIEFCKKLLIWTADHNADVFVK